MVSHHVYYQRALLALVWLFVILHLTWPKRGVTAPAAPVAPETLPPKRHRSTEPPVFEGLTHKPHCALCERDTVQPTPTPAVPPAPMPPPPRRPCVVDTSMHFCPHPRCDDWGWLGLGTLRANGHPSGGLWRQLRCPSCKGSF